LIEEDKHLFELTEIKFFIFVKTTAESMIIWWEKRACIEFLGRKRWFYSPLCAHYWTSI